MTFPGAKTTEAFPPADEAHWRALVQRAIGDRAFESLASTTPEGLLIAPLYSRPAMEAPRAVRQKAGAWRISQRMDHPDPPTANRMALVDLENGADALVLVVAQAPAGRGFGVAISSESNLDVALAGVELDLISIRLDAGVGALEIANLFEKIARTRRLTSASLDVDFGHDPIGNFARSGAVAAPSETMARESAAASKSLRAAGFSGRLLLADGRPYHEAGAGEAQELAAVLATSVAYLRLLEADGLSLEEARDEIAFLLAADADEYLTLAKFRALRQLWPQVERACGLAPKPLRLHGETSFRMMTKCDPWTNILRAAMAVFSTGVGGADAIAALPFTLALGLPDEFARRIARNTQLLLIQEAHLGKVADPAAGAGAFEALTAQLCERAWALFQKIEASGGVIASLEKGLLQAEIAATAAARHEAIAHRAPGIIGTSAFPDLAENAVSVLAEATGSNAPPLAGGQCAPLRSHRDAEPYEKLRAVFDAELMRTGLRPRLFLIGLGSREGFAPPMSFAENFFAAGGFENMSNGGFESAGEAGEAFRQSRSKLACICPSDAVSADIIAEAARGLREAGAKRIYIAARPSATEASLRESGVEEFISDGCDALAILEQALQTAIGDA